MNVQELKQDFDSEYIGQSKTVKSRAAEIPAGYLIVKRILDIGLSLIGTLLLSPLMIILTAAVKLTSPGPAIYRQERVGRGGKAFTIYKFRTMRVDAEKAPVWALKNDDRVTRVGAVLRKYHFDELPQLFNILMGDMSVVGPRPEREYFYRQFERDIPDFRYRLLVKPGLTGLAQINGGYDITPAEKFIFDKRYIADLSAANDIAIIFKTLMVVCRGKGAR